MAEFVLTTPDGVRYKVTAETEQQAYSALQKMLGGAMPAAEEKPGMLERAGNWLTGANRDENIGGPLSLDLPMTSGQSAQMTALLATTVSPDRLKSGILKIEPDTQFREDSLGNLVALWPRKDERGKVTGYQQFYPNPAGLDTSDVMRASGAVAAATPVGRAVRAVGLPTAGALGGATVGATEAALIEGASSQLSGAPYQYSDIPYGALGGAAGDVLARTVQGLVAAARSVGPQSVIDSSGNLLPQYARLVRRAGLDPNQVSAAVAADIMNLSRAGAEPSQAAISAMSRGLPTPVPMTQGQLTGSGRQQLFEDVVSKGAYGDLAAAPMTAQRQRQQAALTQNLDQILESLRPGSAPIARGEGGELAQTSLASTRAAEKAKADVLYSQARATSAVVDPDAALSIADAMRSTYRQGFGARTAPTVAALLDDFDAVASTGDIKSMMQWREQVSNLRKGAPTVDAVAAGQVIEQFDAKIKEAIDTAMLSGDADAVSKWGSAISNYADFASKWKSQGGILNMLTTQVGRDGERVFKVAPTQAADVVFSATASGLAAKTGLPRDLITLKRNLPANEWNAMRQEAFIRLMDTSRGAMRGGETQVSGVNFKKQWENLREKNPGVVNGLFTKEEQNLIQQFADVSARATNTLANTSNTAVAAAGLIQNIASSLGGTGVAQFLLRVPVAKALTQAYGGSRAAMAASGRVPPGATPLTTGAAGAGAAAANTEEGRGQINAIPSAVGGMYNRLMGLLGE
jgi:hypothetical protein